VVEDGVYSGECEKRGVVFPGPVGAAIETHGRAQ
jgi:hypothetical protein